LRQLMGASVGKAFSALLQGVGQYTIAQRQASASQGENNTA
jgi:hypothetical protein